MKTVNIKMDERIVHRLMASGALCAADFKCLDCESKQCVWEIALNNMAVQTTQEYGCKIIHEIHLIKGNDIKR